MIYYYIFALIFVLIDQVTKYVVVQNIALYETVPFIPQLLSWTFVKNEGAAWSILEGKMWFFYIVTSIVLIILIYMLQTQGKKSGPLFKFGLSLILAGAIGNFIDRLMQGYVVDMVQLEFIRFPIFNVADICLTIGVVLIAIYILTEELQQKKKGDSHEKNN